MMRDPIEDTQEFKQALERIQPLLDELEKRLEDSNYGMGSCHIYWAKKKKLLKDLGIEWKTPAEMNPHVLFD
ncbi:MAG: hypothetical protein GX757_11765 [Clostridiales bacterium]|nr:hypothetical protein [Clostridiales bacterium]